MNDTTTPASSPKTNATVLLVEDERPVRALARRILEDEGYQVLEAVNGEEGIDRLAGAAVVDLLIVDLHMPVLGGEEMVRRVHAGRPGLPVLYLTGRIDGLMDARPLNPREAFLGKPFTPTGLKEAVALMLYGTIRRPHVA